MYENDIKVGIFQYNDMFTSVFITNFEKIMLERKIDNENAVVIDSSVIKPLQYTEEKHLVTHDLTCFFNIINSLAPILDNKEESIKIAKLIEKVLCTHRKYTQCNMQLLTITNIYLIYFEGLKEDEKFTLTRKVATNNDPQLKVFLKKIFNHYATRLSDKRKKQLDLQGPQGCDNFLIKLFDYHSKCRVAGEKLNYLQWLELATIYEEFLGAQIYSETAKELFKEFGITQSETIINLENASGKKLRDFQSKLDINLFENVALYSYLQNIVAKKCGFVEDRSWNPGCSIDIFLDCIKNKGFLSVAGWFGKSFYKKEPGQLKIGSLEVLSWPAGSFNPAACIMTTHQIMIVGASKAGFEKTVQDLVYFIDPNEVNIANYSIFVMSYKSFCQRINTILGFRFEKPKPNDCFLYTHPTFSKNSQLTNNAPQKGKFNSPATTHPGTNFWRPRCTTITTVATTAGIAACAIAMAFYK